MTIAYGKLTTFTYFTAASGELDAWTDKDLYTAYGIPAGAIVEIGIGNYNTGATSSAGVRTNGSSLDRRITIHEAEYPSGSGSHISMFVKTDTNGYIEFYADDVNVRFHILGWVTGTDFTELMTSFQLTSTGWNTDIGESTHDVPASRVAHFIVTNNNTNACQFGGVRNTASSTNRYRDIHEAEGGGEIGLSWISKTDSSGNLDFYAEATTTITFYSLGYFSTAIDFVEAWQVMQPSGTVDTWQAWDVSAYLDEDGRIGYFSGWNLNGAYSRLIGIRIYDGSATYGTRRVAEHEAEGGANNGISMITETDASGRVELYVQGVNTDYGYCFQGYFLDGTTPTNHTFTETDLIGLTDGISTKVTLKKTLTDLLGLTDSISSKVSLKKTLADILGLTDGISTKVAVKKTLTDLLGLKDSASTKVNLKVPINNTPSQFGVSGRPSTWGSDTNYQTSIVQEVIDFMDEKGLNLYRMCFFIGTSENTIKTCVQYYLEHCDHKLILNYYHNTSATVNWVDSTALALSLLNYFSSYQNRIVIEPYNQFAQSFTEIQNFVNTIRNAGYTSKIYCSRWYTQDPQDFIDITDSLYTHIICGQQQYLNTIGLAAAKSRTQVFIDAGVEVIDGEVGAHVSEYPYFTQDLVDDVNEYLAWAADNGTSACVWMLQGMRNYYVDSSTSYESLGLTYPSLGEGVGLKDSVSIKLGYTTSQIDITGLIDAAATVAEKFVSSADKVGLKDSASTVANLKTTQTDKTGLLDTVKIKLSTHGTEVETTGLVDSNKITLTTHLNQQEIAGLLDSARVDLINLLVIAEKAGLKDTASINVTKVPMRNVRIHLKTISSRRLKLRGRGRAA